MLYEKITKQELKAMENEHGFTPNYSYEDYVTVRDEETGEITEEYYVNLTVHKTADEVYEEWLASKDNPPTPELTEIDVLKARLDQTEATLLEMMIEKMKLEQMNVVKEVM